MRTVCVSKPVKAGTRTTAAVQDAAGIRQQSSPVARLRNALATHVPATLLAAALTVAPASAFQPLTSVQGRAPCPVADVADSLPYNPDYFTPPSEEKKEALGQLEGVFGLLAVGAVAAVSLGGGKGSSQAAGRDAAAGKKPAARVGSAKKTVAPPSRKTVAPVKKAPAKPAPKATARGKATGTGQAKAGAAATKKKWF